jgi:prephenate dehydrogenase
MPETHLINRVTVVGCGLIGGSFAAALRKYTTGIHITAWDRAEVSARAKTAGLADLSASGDVGAAVQNADLVFIALPISVTLDLLPAIAGHAPPRALITDACSTKVRVLQVAEDIFSSADSLFVGGHPMAGKEVGGIANADADLFRDATYALVGPTASAVRVSEPARQRDQSTINPPGESTADAPAHRLPLSDPRVSAFLKIIQKFGARPLWLGPQQHDYAVGLASHLPQLAAVALGSFLYDHLDENGLPITLAGPGLRDSLRLAGSPYAMWRDILLTNREVLSASLDLFARKLEDLREKLASRELEADFDAANELYKLLRSL